MKTNVDEGYVRREMGIAAQLLKGVGDDYDGRTGELVAGVGAALLRVSRVLSKFGPVFKKSAAKIEASVNGLINDAEKIDEGVAMRRRGTMMSDLFEGSSLNERASNAMTLGATKGMLDFFWHPVTHDAEVGLGGEWWSGDLERASGVEADFHHRKEKVDDGYKPVYIKWENETGDSVVFTIRGGFLSKPATVEFGLKKVVSE